MRSHVTRHLKWRDLRTVKFQYRKRYEVTCDTISGTDVILNAGFQYRKRYEVTCDSDYS